MTSLYTNMPSLPVRSKKGKDEDEGKQFRILLDNLFRFVNLYICVYIYICTCTVSNDTEVVLSVRTTSPSLYYGKGVFPVRTVRILFSITPLSFRNV